MAAVAPAVAVAAPGPVTTEFGHSVPPQGPHTVTFHIPGWDTAIRFRDGDLSIFAKLRSIYPRFTPFGPARQLANALGDKLGAVPGQDGVLVFLHPDTFAAHRANSTSPHRKQHRLADGDLGFHVVDVDGVRLYCVVYPLDKTPGAIGIWQHAGTGVSTRLAEALVPSAEAGLAALVDWPRRTSSSSSLDGDGEDVPAPTYLPEVAAHAQLRRRIRDLLHRAPVDPAAVAVRDDDVYLYQTGMAAIYRLTKALARRDPGGTALLLGSIFHNTYHLVEEAPAGMRHFGACDAASGVMDEVEAWLEGHYREGRTVGYAFLEFPSNPILVSADLKRLRQIADKYAFPLVVDETIGSFANIDVLPVADCIVSSLTKSFSGYADVMAGAVVLNPLAPSYAALKPLLAALHHNELFAGDADVLLANSADYLARTAILNRNAAALAAALAASPHVSSSASASAPARAVLYPTTSDTLAHYDAFRRPASPDLPNPGHGCLLSVDFRSEPAAAAFYDALPFHCTPHLGAHRTLALPFNALVWGRDPADAARHARYGVRQAQIRISVGLEDDAELVAAVQHALARAAEVYDGGSGKREGKMGEDVEGEEEGGEKSSLPQNVAKDAGSSEADVKVVAEETSANYTH